MRVSAFCYNSSRHMEYQLRDGTRFIVDYYTDGILSNGYYHMPIVQKGIWKRTLRELIENVFNGNIQRASEVLYEIYKKPEYHRETLYRYVFGKSRKDIRERKAKKIVEYAYSEGIVNEVKRELKKKECIGTETESLGTSQCERQLKTIHVRVLAKELEK